MFELPINPGYAIGATLRLAETMLLDAMVASKRLAELLIWAEPRHQRLPPGGVFHTYRYQCVPPCYACRGGDCRCARQG
jgi:hypothetical protein